MANDSGWHAGSSQQFADPPGLPGNVLRLLHGHGLSRPGELGQGLLLLAQQALPLVQERRAACLHLQRAEIQLFGGVRHRPGALCDDDFVVEAVFPQHLLDEDLVAIFHQPLAQWLLAAVGLQDQALLAVQTRFAIVEDVADRLAAHAADTDRRDPVSRLDRCQAIGPAHGDPLVQVVLAHGAFGRAERRLCHFAGHRRGDGATAHQRHRQVAVIRADIGQARTCWHMRRHVLQAHGQCLFVQLQPLFITSARHFWPDRDGILPSYAVHYKCLPSDGLTTNAPSTFTQLRRTHAKALLEGGRHVRLGVETAGEGDLRQAGC
ncbi:hypothetical protein EMIT0P171_90261 [Pseudomonas sp. IT-P171]